MENERFIYVVVTAISAEKLEERVIQRMELGFRPIGGVAVVYSVADDYHFYQAMIKNDD